MHNSIKVKILDWSIRCLIGVIVVLSAVTVHGPDGSNEGVGRPEK